MFLCYTSATEDVFLLCDYKIIVPWLNKEFTLKSSAEIDFLHRGVP